MFLIIKAVLNRPSYLSGYQQSKYGNHENLVSDGSTGWLVKQSSDDDDDTEATSVLRDEDNMTLKDVSTLGKSNKCEH